MTSSPTSFVWIKDLPVRKHYLAFVIILLAAVVLGQEVQAVNYRLTDSSETAALPMAHLEGWGADGAELLFSSPQGYWRVSMRGEWSGPYAVAPIRFGRGQETAAGEIASDHATLRKVHQPIDEFGGVVPLNSLREQLGGFHDAGLYHLGDAQLSPDQRWWVVEVFPTGAESMRAAQIWLVDARTGEGRMLAEAGVGAHSPRWSPDGARLAFLRAHQVLTLNIDVARARAAGQPPNSAETIAALPSGLLIPATDYEIDHLLTPPSTIRVIHHPANPCRDVPDWHVDVLPFEEYVRRVAPTEMPALWAMEALKVQAVAARTYAWYHINLGREEYDVSDWTNFQAMCDDRMHARSDAATAETAGMHMRFLGAPILAMYSAENSHPTRSAREAFSSDVSYLRAIADPVGLGHGRRGHGVGMSQWGARRWADDYGWDFRQILAHYYRGAQLSPAPGGAGQSAQLTPWHQHYVNNNALWLTASAFAAAPIETVAFVESSTGTVLAADLVGDNAWGAILDVSTFSDRNLSQPLQVYPRITAETGEVFNGTPARVGLDRQRPTALLSSPITTSTSLTVSLQTQATDSGPSGLHGWGLSNDWVWQGEELYHTDGFGVMIEDGDASNGKAWRAQAGVHAPGAWYGPYTRTLPAGFVYRALFRLRTDNVTTDAVVAQLDVTDDAGERLLGLRTLRGLDFPQPNVYHEFAVDFHLLDAISDGLEFRVAWPGNANLVFDRVLITTFPGSAAPSAWRLSPGEGVKTVIGKAYDRAQNASDDAMVTIEVVDVHPPSGWELLSPLQWANNPTPEVRVRVFDEISGLNPEAVFFRFSRDGGASWSAWAAATTTAQPGSTRKETLRADVPFQGEGADTNRVQFRAADMKGQVGDSPIYTIPVDLSPPQPLLNVDPQPAASGWYTAPVSITLGGSDALSGFQHAEYRFSDGVTWQTYSDAISLDAEGVYRLEYRAWDRAGNVSPVMTRTLSIDFTPPTATISAPPTAGSQIPVSWSGHDATAGVLNYDVQVRHNDAAWQAWLSQTPATQAVYPATPAEGLYAFRVRALDAAGNLGSWSEEAVVLVPTQVRYIPVVSR